MASTDLGAAERARETAGEATEQAAEVASTAADAAGQVADSAREQARAVGDAVREQMGEVTSEVARQSRNVAEDAKEQLHGQARVQTEKLADALRRVSDQVSGMLEGRPPEEGPVRDYVQQASTKVNELASRMQERGFDRIVNDAERFARRRPGVFLLGAAAAGMVVGRFLRGTRDEDPSSNGALHPGGDGGQAPTPAVAAPPPLPAVPRETATTTTVTPPAPPLLTSTELPTTDRTVP